MPLTTRALTQGLRLIDAEIERIANELNSLDAIVGDGDLGVTLTLCARGIAEALDQLPEDVGMALMKCAEVIMKCSGSSFATLLASGFMGAAKATHGRKDVAWKEISNILGAAQQAMMLRGKSSLGDKTVIDAIDAARGAAEGLDDPRAIIEAAQKAVDGVMKHLRGQPIKAGRARIWGEKSIGLDDPGTVAFRHMLDSLGTRTECLAENGSISEKNSKAVTRLNN